jgi:hypothetical protein
MTTKSAGLVTDNTLREFQDLMDQGDNFFKIELLRPAKKYYMQALQLNIDSEKVKQKIAECDKLLTFEKRVIWILSTIVAAVVIMWTIIKN